MKLPVAEGDRFFVLWKAVRAIGPSAEPVVVQSTPMFWSFSQEPDAILVYSDLDRMVAVLTELDGHEGWNGFASGYDPIDYIRAFDVTTVAEVWDAHNLLLDFSAVEVLLLQRYTEEQRTTWLGELPNVRIRGVTVIGGTKWQTA